MFNFLLLLTLLSIAYAYNNNHHPGFRGYQAPKKLFQHYDVWLRQGEVYKFSFNPRGKIGVFDYNWNIESCVNIQLTCTTGRKPRDCQNGLQIYSHNFRSYPNCQGGRTLNIDPRNNKVTVKINNHSSQLVQFNCLAKAVGRHYCDCGKKNQGKIHGGVAVTSKDYPMMAALRFKGQAAPFCGATIINFKQVLTAAHCTNSINIKSENVEVVTGMGTYTRSYAIGSFKKHEGYNDNTDVNDIALVTVKKFIHFSDIASEVCLPFKYQKIGFTNQKVDVVGYGATDIGRRPSQQMRKAQVKVVRMANCKYAPFKTDYRFMCTQERGRDSCAYDSGGPVLISREVNSNMSRNFLVGIVSTGPGDCKGYDGGTTNTRVGPFVNWIEKNTPRGICYCKP